MISSSSSSSSFSDHDLVLIGGDNAPTNLTIIHGHATGFNFLAKCCLFLSFIERLLIIPPCILLFDAGTRHSLSNLFWRMS